MDKTLLHASSPLASQQLDSILALTSDLNPIQKAWVSGFLAGQQLSDSQVNVSSHSASPVTMTILVGSQTGNAKQVAQALADQAAQQGLACELVNMADFKPQQLKKIRFLAIVVSTHGEGEPPDDALPLHKFIYSKKAPQLPELAYGVFALGDASYEHFCKTGHDFHTQLASLGAQAMHDVIECDVTFAKQADEWQQQILALLAAQQPSTTQPLASVTPIHAPVSRGYSRDTPFSAELLTNQTITSRHATKDVRHIELSLADSGISYQPGDALGVWFSNCANDVAAIAHALDLDLQTEVTFDEQTTSLLTILTEYAELSQLTPKFVQQYAQLNADQALIQQLADQTLLRSFLASYQLVDLVQQYPLVITAQAFVDLLRPMVPRLYSIASAQSEVEDEVHLTVAVVEYDAHGRLHTGAASGFLAARAEQIGHVKVYVQANPHFRLPSDPSRDVIMIGPGTGIAPFRAFLQERDATSAAGRNWLFFGNQRFLDDFLYQAELVKYRDQGLLNRFDVAFSRDQAEKIYVQDRIREHGAELFAWLQNGAHLYICGDAQRMAKDVHAALTEVLQTHGGMDQAQAETYLDDLRSQQRYQKDVY